MSENNRDNLHYRFAEDKTGGRRIAQPRDNDRYNSARSASTRVKVYQQN